jgi:hypothetical protein
MPRRFAGWPLAILTATLGIPSGGALASTDVACVDTPIVQWSTGAGGNDHYYQGVCGDLRWPQARAAAEAKGGYLATSTSAAENTFIFSLIDQAQYWSPFSYGNFGPWLGGYQDPAPCTGTGTEPDGCWTWVSGEAFSYTNWDSGEPNNGQNEDEHHLHFFDGEGSRSATWNDILGSPGQIFAYLVEWNTDPNPPVNRTATEKCKNAKRGTATLTWNDAAGNSVGSSTLTCRGSNKSVQPVQQPGEADGYTLTMTVKNADGQKKKCSSSGSFTAGQAQTITATCKKPPAKTTFTLT